MSDALEVWLDVHFLDRPVQLGALSHDRGTVRFRYHAPWLARLPQLTTCFTIFPASDAKPVLQGIDASGVGAAPLAVRAKTPM